MPKPKKTKKVKAWGVYVKDYGGVICTAQTKEEAEQLRISEYSQVSMCRSEKDFKVVPVTITYTI